MANVLESNVPAGALAEKWTRHKDNLKLVNPANRRQFSIIIVGTGLAGSSAAATLAELGYHVKIFCINDTPRRAHAIAAQGGINAAKNYPNDGDSIQRLFRDTIKGGDFRSREANVYRLAEVSNEIIDQSVAQGVPFAREYSGYLANRSFGGAQVARTFYARGQTGQQLLLGAYAAMMKEVRQGNLQVFPRCEMMELVVADGQARGIVVRNLFTGKLQAYAADAVVLATGGFGNVFFLSTNAKSSNMSAAWGAYKQGAFFANPCFTQIHPTCIPTKGDYQSKLTLMSESLRNDGRIWVPQSDREQRTPNAIPEAERDYFLERRYPAFGNLTPRDIASRAVKKACDEGYGVGATGQAVYLDFRDALERLGRQTIKDRYGNIFEIYERITAQSPYDEPMMIYPATHYTMGGLWVDYNLMTTIPGLFAIGEVNFSDHGANRLGASGLMQGLADGYFILPYTIAGYLADQTPGTVTAEHPAFAATARHVHDKIERVLGIKGKRPVNSIHRELGKIIWEQCGMVRNEAGLRQAAERIPALRQEFWENVAVPGTADDFNQSLERALRLADYLEFAGLMVQDALHRRESCGAHFREEYQTEEGEAKRDDESFCYVGAWEHAGEDRAARLHKEPLAFEYVELTERKYK